MKILTALLITAASAAAEWHAGVARADITPVQAVWMAGYGSRTKPMEGVRQRIWAKALALRDSTGATSVLVTLDLCDIYRDFAESIAKEVRDRAGIPRERLIFNTSHTHSSPITDEASAQNYVHLMGGNPEPHRAAIARYSKFLRARIVQAILDSTRALQPATLQFGQGFAGIAVNRRRVWKRELPGPVDQDVPVLAVRNRQGNLIAVAVGYACHSTVMSDYRISGDWPGYAQEAIEASNPGAIALFVQGAGADANPLPRRTEDLARRHGKTLADAVDEVLQSRMKAMDEPLRAVMDYVDLRFQMPSRQELERRLEDKSSDVRRHAKGLLDRLNREGKIPQTHPYPAQVWRFGGGLALLVLGGEVVADYSLRFKRQYGADNLWVAGYSNDVFAYIPSLRVLREGGYEGATAMHWDGHAGPFTEDVEESIAAKVDELMRRYQ